MEKERERERPKKPVFGGGILRRGKVKKEGGFRPQKGLGGGPAFPEKKEGQATSEYQTTNRERIEKKDHREKAVFWWCDIRKKKDFKRGGAEGFRPQKGLDKGPAFPKKNKGGKGENTKRETN